MKRTLLVLIFLWGGSINATTITSRVSDSADDASKSTVASTVSLNLTSHFLGWAFTYPHNVGFRFRNITIPPGSTINSARVTFRGIVVPADDSTGNANTVNIIFYGHDADNSSAFTVDTANWNARQATSASVTWSPGRFTHGVDSVGPNISTVIQEIVDRAGWASGNAVTIFVNDNSTPATNSYRRVRAYEGDNLNGALLTIDYTAGGGGGPSTTDLYIKGGTTLKGGTTVK